MYMTLQCYVVSVRNDMMNDLRVTNAVYCAGLRPNGALVRTAVLVAS